MVWTDPAAVRTVIDAVHARLERGDLQLSLDEATTLVRRHYDADRSVYRVRRLNGGMVNHVLQLFTDGQPESVVAKLNTPAHASLLAREAETLRWYREHTKLPVPEPLSYIDGPNLAEARIAADGVAALQGDLARHLTELHSYRAEQYGNALDQQGSAARWVDLFRPMIDGEFQAVRDQLSSRSRWVLTEVIDHLDQWLPETNEPRLVHGDLWATNILVDDRHPSRPRVLAFVDCGAIFADVEYELSYLTLFRTVQDPFFREYGLKLRDGFERRCRVYWINTMMLHVRMFGDRYLPSCEQLAMQLQQLM